METKHRLISVSLCSELRPEVQQSRRIRRKGDYRKAMSVVEVRLFQSGAAYPMCPRCRITLEREYQNFCDRCGQKLKWAVYYLIALLLNL